MSIQANFPAIKPTLLLDFANTEALDPRITFTRASTGTYYDGKTVAKAEENLLTYSQEFDNAVWTKSNTAITANSIAAPDGSTTADSLTENTATASHVVFRSAGSLTGRYTASCYVKAAGRTWCYMEPLGDTATLTYFNLSGSGSVGTTGPGVTASITAVGNDWYRIVTTYNYAAAAGFVVVGAATGDAVPSYAGNGAIALYIWGTQLEQRSFATAYTPTTTAPITNYIPVLQTASAGTPRFDHNPITGESLGLLIEEQRTNLLTYSSDFDNPAWLKSGVTVSANAVVAPDGTQTADKLVENSTNSAKYLRATNGAASAGSVSFYAKAGERSHALLFSLTTDNSVVWFNLVTGTVGANQGAATSTSITAVGNGWYRCQATFPSMSANNVAIGVASSNNTFSYTGDGFSGIYIWGAQLEAGAFPTSYIPTVASQVTRAADSASMTGANFSSWFNPSSGTVYSEFLLNSAAGNFPSAYSINDGTTNNRIQPYQNNSLTSIGFDITTGGAAQAAVNITVPNLTTSYVRHAGAYQTNSVNAAANGALGTEDTAAALAAYTRLNIGANAFPQAANCWVKRIAYYPVRVTNAQLQALTS